MKFLIKKGQRKTLQLNCTEVVIEITEYRPKSKRAERLKIKAKVVSPQTNQARL